MPTKPVISFDSQVEGKPTKVHVGFRYNYCDHEDAPLCGCDLALPFDDRSTVEQPGRKAAETYIIVYPVSIPWPGIVKYRTIFAPLIEEARARLADRGGGLSLARTFIVLCVDDNRVYRNLWYMYDNKLVHIREVAKQP